MIVRELTTPKNEIVWVQYLHDGKPTHVITSTTLRNYYYLYEVKNNALIRTKYKSKDPTELEKYIKYV